MVLVPIQWLCQCEVDEARRMVLILIEGALVECDQRMSSAVRLVWSAYWVSVRSRVLESAQGGITRSLVTRMHESNRGRTSAVALGAG